MLSRCGTSRIRWRTGGPVGAGAEELAVDTGGGGAGAADGEGLRVPSSCGRGEAGALESRLERRSMLLRPLGDEEVCS